MSALPDSNSPPPAAPKIGRVDIHCHMLPDVDDGCQTIADSIACAKIMVAEGYTHSFCTPHVWPSLPNNTRATIPRMVAGLQRHLDEAGVPLKLLPGGEINLRDDTLETVPRELVSYNMAGRYVLIDLWADKLPDFFAPNVRWLQSQGAKVILAHPERMRAVQAGPAIADYFAELGLLLQGNLQCFGDPPHADTRRVAEKYLREGRYFMLASDLHNPASMPVRIAGLHRAIELVGESAVWELTSTHPRMLLPQ